MSLGAACFQPREDPTRRYNVGTRQQFVQVGSRTQRVEHGSFVRREQTVFFSQHRQSRDHVAESGERQGPPVFAWRRRRTVFGNARHRVWWRRHCAMAKGALTGRLSMNHDGGGAVSRARAACHPSRTRQPARHCFWLARWRADSGGQDGGGGLLDARGLLITVMLDDAHVHLMCSWEGVEEARGSSSLMKRGSRCPWRGLRAPCQRLDRTGTHGSGRVWR